MNPIVMTSLYADVMLLLVTISAIPEFTLTGALVSLQVCAKPF